MGGGSPSPSQSKRDESVNYTKYIMPLESLRFVRDFEDQLLCLQDQLLNEVRMSQSDPKWQETINSLPKGLKERMKIPKKDPTPYEQLVGLRNTIHANAEITHGAENLPRPVRGQETFGFSWVAHCQAAFLAGVQPPAFSLSEIEALAETGLDYWSNKISNWRSCPEDFIEHITAIEKHDWRQCGILELPPEHRIGSPMPHETPTDIYLDLAVEQLVFTAFMQLARYAEIRRCVLKLRELGKPDTGIKARQQISQPGKIRNTWHQLRTAAFMIKQCTASQLRTAFAGGPGRGKVKKNLYPITLLDPGVFDKLPPDMRASFDLMMGATGGWVQPFLSGFSNSNIDLRYDSCLAEEDGEDWFHPALARYSLYPSDFRYVPDTKQIELNKLYGELEVEQAKLADMDQFAMLDPFFQRLLSEQNASNDLYSSVASVYAPQDEHRELQSMLNVDNLQISDELKNAMKNITRACLTLAVQCGKQHDVLRALPGGGLKRVFPIRRLFRDPLQVRVETSKDFFEGFEAIMQITFDMPWDQMMATFEFGDERSKPSSETSLNLPNSTKVHSAQRQEELSGVAAQSLSSEPHTISGHRYRQTSGSSIPISKTKASATSSEEIQRTSGLRGTDARVPRDEAKGNAPTYIVNGKQMKLIHRIFDGDDGRVGSVRWFDLDKLMKRLGFRVELRTGSIVTWIPPLGQGRPMNVHRPHPECSMGPKSTVNLAKRLMQRSSKKALRCATGVPAMELRRIRMPRTKPELPGRTDSKGDDIK